MNKKVLTIFLSLCLIFSSLPFALATQTTQPEPEAQVLAEETSTHTTNDDAWISDVSSSYVSSSYAPSSEVTSSGASSEDPVEPKPKPEVKYTLTYNSNGGNGEMESEEITEGLTALSECAFTAPEGKEFAGWSRTSDGDILTSGYVYITEDTTVYAIWKGTASSEPDIPSEDPSEPDIPSDDPSKPDTPSEDPSDPSEPDAPSDEPSDPSDPSEPDAPSDEPSDPSDPSEPDEPAKQGWYKAGSNWQYYKDGIALTGWHDDIPGWEGQWFYFDAISGTCVMRTGWLQIGNEFYYLNESGIMQTGWQFIAWSGGANWFYFNESGLMLKNTTTPDGYYVDENGVWRS